MHISYFKDNMTLLSIYALILQCVLTDGNKRIKYIDESQTGTHIMSDYSNVSQGQTNIINSQEQRSENAPKDF